MICEKCGAVLPDDATFCGECGAKVKKTKKKSGALVSAKSEANRFKLISLVLAILCLVFGIGWMATSHSAYRSIDNYEEEAVKVERAGVQLSGTYVVGEDSELPAGRYNIYPPDGESYLNVDIYANMEDAKAKYDEDYNSYAIEQLYSLARGFKLKEGQVVVIDYDSAYFELVSEEVTEDTTEETTATESTEAVTTDAAQEGTDASNE